MLLDRFCADQSTVTFDSTAAIDSTVTSCPFNGQVNASKYINVNRPPEHSGTHQSQGASSVQSPGGLGPPKVRKISGILHAEISYDVVFVFRRILGGFEVPVGAILATFFPENRGKP